MEAHRPPMASARTAASTAFSTTGGTLGTVAVAVLAFSAISGGAFGIEPSVQSVGALPTMLGMVVVAITWSTPSAMMTAELSTMFPSNAGYVLWVLRGLGPVAGFVNAIAMIVSQCISSASVAVQVSQYILQLQPLNEGEQVGYELAAIVIAVILNIIGVDVIERCSRVSLVLVQTPFILIPVLAAVKGMTLDWGALATGTLESASGDTLTTFVSNLCSNVSGWVMLGSMAGEVSSPRRAYPRGLLVAVVLVAANFIFCILLTVVVAPDTSKWRTGYFVTVANDVGPGIAIYTLIIACASSLTNFIPQVMSAANAIAAAARLRMLPPVLGRTNFWIFRTPVLSILIVGIINAVLTPLSFDVLQNIQLLFWGVGLALQFSSFLWLRHTQPNLRRPFQVPGGLPAAWLMSAIFFVMLLIVFYATAKGALFVFIGIVAAIVCLVGLGFVWIRFCGGDQWEQRLPELFDEDACLSSDSDEVGEPETTRLLDIPSINTCV
eukprot:TRINITY_DN4122_c0_g1_i1.p1 TRINITY_DN4122_c0_g1~~TRINITY_DN4122_c0_g1_i1.p1  ORF type:complete len:495 (-),score=71.86 TRINITY_DN4122_c0_g1_i1:52-1536(-)